MNNINKEWFESHNWTICEYPDGQITIMKVKGDFGTEKYKIDRDFGTEKYKIARIDYYPPTEDKMVVEGYYQFYASGNNIEINCRNTTEMLSEKQILSALDVICFDE